MKSLKLDLKKLSPEAIDRIIEAVRNEPAGNVIFESEQAVPVAQNHHAPDLGEVVSHFRDLNEGFPVERFKADYVIAWMLANYPPATVGMRELEQQLSYKQAESNELNDRYVKIRSIIGAMNVPNNYHPDDSDRYYLWTEQKARDLVAVAESANKTALPSPAVMREQAEPVAWRDPKTGSLCTPRNKEYGLKSNYASDYAQYSEPLYEAPPAPFVPEEMPKPDTSKMFVADAIAAISKAEGWNAYRAAMLNHAQKAAPPKSELAQRASELVADTTELANRISDQIGNEYQQLASHAAEQKRNTGIKDLVSSEVADFFAGDATKFVDGKLAAEMQKEIMKRIATCFYAE